MQPPTSTILIVDDQPIGLLSLQGFLDTPEYELLLASDGYEALALAQRHSPDLILLDVMMPGIDGFEVCRRLRADPALAEVPVVMITALDDAQSRLTAIEAGADDFISKPFNSAELQARVRTIARLNRQAKLMNERQRFAWVVEQSEDGYVELNERDEIVYANRQARLLLGLVEGNGLPASVSFFDLARQYYTLEPQEAWATWPETAEGGMPQTRYLVRPESELSQTLWLQVDLLHASELKASDKRLVRLHDVTGQMRLHNDLFSFHSAVQHKLYTPMSAILISLDLLMHRYPKAVSAEMAELIGFAREGAHDLQRTLDEILTYTSLRSASPADRHAPAAALKPLARQVATNLQLKTENLRLNIPDYPEEIRLPLSPQMLEVILWELLDNAKKFHPLNDPQVEIVLERPTPERFRLLVSDNGISLLPEQLKRAWEPYYQVEKSFSGQVPGVGLGLTSVATVIWGSGGSCRLVNRTDGPGTVVDISLPVIQTAAPADESVRTE